MALSSPESPAPQRRVFINRVETPTEEQEELNKMAHGVVAESRSEDVFSCYVCNSLNHKDIQPHPGDIVEAGCLAAQQLPAARYGLFESLPMDLVQSGKLSDLQLEGILYACQRHQMILANGQRAGFFIGDGAGVGKGRQISGIVLDNFARGRSRHVWFSISADLRLDAQRDLNDIGCFVKVIDGCQQLDKETRLFGLSSDFKEGVVFSTYATLVSSVQKGTNRQSRLQQLIDWCGGEQFSGCLIFDECHKAKHFVPGKEEASTKVALAVTTIQRMLPKARVVYCSATGVTDVKNMAFMERLGLWGDGTAFKSFEAFLTSITKRGLGAAEMLAMEMKASGMYVSRGLSFRQAEFGNVEASLTTSQIKVYDTAVHVWNELKKSLEFAIVRTTTATPRIWSVFWSSHQRFFKQLCMSMKVPTIVKEAQQALEAGYCVVIGLQSTGEASLESEITRCGGILHSFISSTEEILVRFITQYFPTQKIKSNGDVVEDKWSVEAKDLLLSFVKKINLPISPLDDLIDQLGGPGKVAEMTGRRGRVVKTEKQPQPHYEARESDSSYVDSLNIQERNSFMNGTKKVAIISDAASTGISLHADLRAANQCRRVHVTIELPWSADKAVQQLGRSHRSNQTSGPIYKLVTTNLGGERRFAAAVARRLQSLGALTKGDRRAATGADLTQFNFDTPYGRSALRNMYQAITMQSICAGVPLSKVLAAAKIPEKFEFTEFNTIARQCLLSMGVTDASFVVKDKEASDVGRFLNRILGLSVERQNLLFSYFCECLNAAIETAKREGRFSEGVTDVSGSSITMVGAPKSVFTEFQKGLMETKHVTVNVDRGIDWDSAVRLFQENGSKKFDGFYCSKREQKGKRLYLLAIQKETSGHLFNITRPNTGRSPFEEEKVDLLHKYKKISLEDAEAGWKAQYERTRDQCIHGLGCKTGTVCKTGCRISQIHLLCGGIIPLLSALELAMAKHADKLGLTKESRSLRVVRVELDNAQRLVGLRYPEQLIPEVTLFLKEEKAVNTVLEKQNGVLGIMAPSNQPSKVSQAHQEQETPINIRTLTKATTPPVTIRNFFKPKIVEKPFEDREERKAQVGTSGENDCIDKECSSKNNVVEEVALDEGSTERQTVPVAKEKVVKSSYFQSQENKSQEHSQQKGTKEVSVRSDAVVLRQLSVETSSSKDNLKSKNSLKRSNNGALLGSNKRQKQSSILCSFGKGTDKSSLIGKQKGVFCPVCEVKFASDAKNADINKHIDGCLS